MILRMTSRVLCWPVINVLFRRTFLGFCGQLGHMRRQGQHEQAVQLILKILMQPHPMFKKQPYRWWFLIRLALSMCQESFMRGHPVSNEYVQELYLLAAKRQAKGYDAAYALVTFALWLFQQGNIKSAIMEAERASKAYPEWSYANYLTGWFELFDPSADPFEHFSLAVQQDFGMLSRIKSDPICQQFPELLKRLQCDRIVKRA